MGEIPSQRCVCAEVGRGEGVVQVSGKGARIMYFALEPVFTDLPWVPHISLGLSWTLNRSTGWGEGGAY